MNFTSALCLGITHPSEHLRWSELTTGTPAAVHVTAQARQVAAAFAALVGCGGAVALTSSLHAFVDLFGQIAASPAVVVHDDGVYPIARWGIERVELREGLVLPFRHHDPDALERRLAEADRLAPARGPRWVVSDGYCPGCARPAPLQAYAALARRYGGRLLIDDTQAIGLFGRAPAAEAPFGRGGGGSLPRWLGGAAPADAVLVASLAKAFGAPVAMLAGSHALIRAFTERSETLLHCSPPSAAALAAAQRALAINAERGDVLRARLVARVRTLRRALRSQGFPVRGGLFPMQRVPLPDAAAAAALRDELARQGIETVVRRARCTREVSLTFMVTAQHEEAELRRAALALAAAARGCRGFTAQHTSTLEA